MPASTVAISFSVDFFCICGILDRQEETLTLVFHIHVIRNRSADSTVGSKFTILISTHFQLEILVCYLLVVWVIKKIAQTFHIFQISWFAIIWTLFIIIIQKSIVQPFYIKWFIPCSWLFFRRSSTQKKFFKIVRNVLDFITNFFPQYYT